MGASRAAGAHVLVSAAVLATFARAVPYPLQLSWDDGRFIRDNPLARTPSWAHLREIFAGPHFEAYHPLHLLAYWLDVPWTDGSALAIHAVNLVPWALAANVLLRAVVGLGLAPAMASVVVLLVTLHPAQVEAVSWATGRKDVLALLFGACAMLFHVRSRSPWDRPAWASRIAFVLAVLSKTTVLPLPALLLLVDVATGRRRLRPALLQQAPSLLVAFAAAPLVWAIWSDNAMLRGASEERAATAPLVGMPTRVVATVAHQLRTALWPADNAPMYDLRAIDALTWLDLTVAGLCLATLGYGLARRRAAPIVAAGGFLVMLLPVANLVPMYFPLQDRYLSLPLLPLALGAGMWLEAGPLPRAGRLALGALLVGGLAARSVQYQGEWQRETRLWGHAVQTQPDAFYAFMKLGEVRRNAGDLEGAIRAYGELKRVDPARKLGYAALLQAVALRDERVHGLAPSRAEAYARAFYVALDDAVALQRLSAAMFASGHLRAMELPLGWALSLQRVPDEALEQAALSHFRGGRPSLGLFYYRRMRDPSQRSDLIAHVRRARREVMELPLFH